NGLLLGPRPEMVGHSLAGASRRPGDARVPRRRGQRPGAEPPRTSGRGADLVAGEPLLRLAPPPRGSLLDQQVGRAARCFLNPALAPAIQARWAGAELGLILPGPGLWSAARGESFLG